MVNCPVCSKSVHASKINAHLDSGCVENIETETLQPVPSFFQRPPKRIEKSSPENQEAHKRLATNGQSGSKRILENGDSRESGNGAVMAKRPKVNLMAKAAPLAERMRPKTLDDVCGQDLVGRSGVLRGLIEQDRVPSMVLWGGPGTGKTTIARLIAHTAGTRFVEINSTSSGVGECKKLFAEAKNELGLTGRKTIIFCDELHRFNKAQQDVFLGPVEAGHITLIGATTENPSFKMSHIHTEQVDRRRHYHYTSARA